MKKVGKNPLISIIVPVYNVKKYVGKCLESIIGQTYKNLEIIIVDDGSIDGSSKICNNYAEKDKRIKVIHQKNCGLSAARNVGIEHANGKYIGFVDSDDWVDSNMYRVLYDTMITHRADISICNFIRAKDEKTIIRKHRPEIVEYTQPEYLKRYFKSDSQSCEYYAWNKLYKKELLTNTQYPIGLTSEDVLGTYKAILRANKIVATTQSCYFYRQNSNSITGMFSKKDFDLINIWDKVVQYTKENAPQYLNLALFNRKRINLTLLYRLAINGRAKQRNYITKVQTLTKSLKQDKHEILKSSIPLSRKLLTILFCVNYSLTAQILYTLKNILKAFHDIPESSYFVLSPKKQTTITTQTLTKTSLFLILVSLIIFFEPQAFKEDTHQLLNQIDNIYKIFKLICSGYIIFLYFKKCRLSKFVTLTCIFQLMCLFSTIINRGSVTRFTGPALTTIVMAMSAEILIHTDNLFSTIKNLLPYFRTIFILNVITILFIDLTPLDSQIYFLGIDNRWIFTYLPWICFEFLYSIHIHNKIDKVSTFMFILSELTLVWEKSYAAMILFALWVFLLIKPKSSTIKHATIIFGGTILANLSIVILRVQNLFSFILNKIGKGVTLSGRTHLWDSVFNIVKTHPWLGNGMQTAAYDKNFFFTSSKTNLPFLKVTHAHNTYMTILYRYGIIGLSLFTIILYLPIKKLKSNYANRYANILFINIIITLFLGIFDTLDYSGLYFILGCAYGIEFMMSNNSNVKFKIKKTTTAKSNINSKISVIVPIYNAQNYLSDCICSILNQTYKNFELILVDDGSTDKSRNIYESINDQRVRIIRQKNSGPSSARNTGLLAAKGKYVTFIDADDTISTNMLSSMISKININDADVAFCILKNRTISQLKSTLFETISYNHCWETCGKLIRRSTIKYPFDPKITIGEDLLFYYKNYKINKKYIFIDEDNLYHYNLHSGSLVHNRATLKDISCLDVLLRIIDDTSLSINLRTFYKAYYIQTYYRIFARSSNSPQMKLAKNKYSKHISLFYRDAKKYHYINFKTFVKHRITWAYNIIERLQLT